MDWLTALLTLVVSIVFLIWWFLLHKPRDLPPGPVGFANITTALEFVKEYENSRLSEFLETLHSKYGPLASIKVGTPTFIFVDGKDLINELFTSSNFAYRPVETFPTIKKILHGSARGVFMHNGEGHAEMRKFVLMALREFGVGKKSIDEMVQEEASILCQELEDMCEDGSAIVPDFRRQMQKASSNVIHHLVFGFRHESENPEWKKLLDCLFGYFAINFLSFPENFLPVLSKFPALHDFLCGYENLKLFELHGGILDYTRKQIEEHRSTYCKDEIRDFVDLYIKFEQEDKKHYTKENVFSAITDLFTEGSESTGTTITTCVLYLLKNPTVLTQLQEEIDEVVGDSVFNRACKDRLIKVQAFMCEVQRYATVADPPPPRTVIKPTALNGYTIPPGAVLLANIARLHHNKEYWGDPEKFRIERWISDKQELLHHQGYFLPFSVGKRSCPGRQLADIEAIIFLVELLQKFTFEKAEDQMELSEEGRPGLVRSPLPFKFKIKKR